MGLISRCKGERSPLTASPFCGIPAPVSVKGLSVTRLASVLLAMEILPRSKELCNRRPLFSFNARVRLKQVVLVWDADPLSWVADELESTVRPGAGNAGVEVICRFHITGLAETREILLGEAEGDGG